LAAESTAPTDTCHNISSLSVTNVKDTDTGQRYAQGNRSADDAQAITQLRSAVKQMQVDSNAQSAKGIMLHGTTSAPGGLMKPSSLST
jgi:hypothetical protein